VLVAVWVAVVHPLLDHQYQNRAMEWDLGYADWGDGVSFWVATSTGVVAKNRTTEFGGHQCLPRTCFAMAGVFVSTGELRLFIRQGLDRFPVAFTYSTAPWSPLCASCQQTAKSLRCSPTRPFVIEPSLIRRGTPPYVLLARSIASWHQFWVFWLPGELP
jgi:hypothetical protein